MQNLPGGVKGVTDVTAPNEPGLTGVVLADQAAVVLSVVTPGFDWNGYMETAYPLS